MVSLVSFTSVVSWKTCHFIDFWKFHSVCSFKAFHSWHSFDMIYFLSIGYWFYHIYFVFAIYIIYCAHCINRDSFYFIHLLSISPALSILFALCVYLHHLLAVTWSCRDSCALSVSHISMYFTCIINILNPVASYSCFKMYLSYFLFDQLLDIHIISSSKSQHSSHRGCCQTVTAANSQE